MSDETKKMERHTYIEGELFPEFAAASQGGGNDQPECSESVDQWKWRYAEPVLHTRPRALIAPALVLAIYRETQ